MVMPVPSPAHHALKILEGTWIGEEQMHPSPFVPSGASAMGRVVNRIALDGFAVIQDYEQENDGKVNFRGHGIFRWDAAKSAYVLHWFDSFGLPPTEYVGSLDDKVFTLTSAIQDGFARATFDFSHHGHYHYLLEVSPDGAAWQPSMEGRYDRQSPVG